MIRVLGNGQAYAPFSEYIVIDSIIILLISHYAYGRGGMTVNHAHPANFPSYHHLMMQGINLSVTLAPGKDNC